MNKRKYIVKRETLVGEMNMGHAVYMRVGGKGGMQNLVRVAVCPCSHAFSLARALNKLHATTVNGFELAQSRQ